MSLPWEQDPQEDPAQTEPTESPLPNPGDNVVSPPDPAPTWTPSPQDTVPATGTIHIPDSVPGQTVDLKASVKKAFQEVFEEARPQLQKQITDYVSEILGQSLTGQEAQPLDPVIESTDVQGHLSVVQDAKNRSFRTLWQGLSVDLLMSLVLLVSTLGDFNPLDKQAWILLAGLVTKTVLQTVVSYVARLKITPTTVVDGQTVKIVPASVPKV